MKRRKQSHMVLGAFLLGALAVLTILTFRLAGLSVTPRTEWTVWFGADAAIEEGVEVLSSGTKVGNVRDVTLGNAQDMQAGRYVKAVLSIDKSVTLWTGARIALNPRALLGGYLVTLDRGQPGARQLSPDEPLPGIVRTGAMQELTLLMRENRENFRRITDNFAVVTERMERGEGSLGAFLKDDEVYEQFRIAARNIAELVTALNSEDSALGRLAREPEMYEDLRAGVRNLREITEKVNSGNGLVARLLRDEEMAQGVSDTVQDVRDLVAGVRRGDGTIGLLLKDDQVREDITVGIRSLRGFVERLNESEGTLSMLMSDPEVYENLRVVTANLRQLTEDVQAGRGNIGLLLKDDALYKEAQLFFESLRESTEIARENAPLSSLSSFTSLFFNVLN